jgi:hypothetical protein
MWIDSDIVFDPNDVSAATTFPSPALSVLERGYQVLNRFLVRIAISECIARTFVLPDFRQAARKSGDIFYSTS